MAGVLQRAQTFAILRLKAARRTLENMMTPATSLEMELTATGRDISNFLRQRRSNPRQYIEYGKRHLAALRTRAPALCACLTADAERILRHEFDLLGSGVRHYKDPDRASREGGYEPIDWYLDPVRNLRFPRGIPYKEWKLYEMRPANADVKYPWELSRSQHLVTLGQAWALTGESRFAREIAGQIADFIEANPTGVGVNWTCTMDVGLRAVNWCLALALVLDCEALNEEFWARAYGALFEHGLFIRANLENTYEVTSNHFLCNVIGLHYLGAEFADFPSGQKWTEFALKALETEIDVQVLDDGADFESALPYHRLVTELFLGSARLAAMQERPLSGHYHDVLTKMVDYLVGTMRPDGRMPVLGDADDGRLHILSKQGDWDRQDARHLLGPASLLLKRPDWLQARGDEAVWETAWWGFDPAPVQEGAGRPADIVKLFPEAGVAIARRGGHYLAITNGIVGTKGFGNHKHNDLLGFELHVAGAPLLVDAGSYVYTSDFPARNAFRSTSAHNTVMIDGVEQNEVNLEWIFRMFEKAEPKHLRFEEAEGVLYYQGQHSGYARLDHPLTHTRSFRFDLGTGALELEDLLHGDGDHSVEWTFQAAPHVAISQTGASSALLEAGAQKRVLQADARLALKIEEAAISPSYGVKKPAKRIVLSWAGQISGVMTVQTRIAAPA